MGEGAIFKDDESRAGEGALSARKGRQWLAGGIGKSPVTEEAGEAEKEDDNCFSVLIRVKEQGNAAVCNASNIYITSITPSPTVQDNLQEARRKTSPAHYLILRNGNL